MCFIVSLCIETSLFAFSALLFIPPLHYKAVGDSMFGRQPNSWCRISPGWSLYLQSAGDFILCKPASILQLQMIHIQLAQKDQITY